MAWLGCGSRHAGLGGWRTACGINCNPIRLGRGGGLPHAAEWRQIGGRNVADFNVHGGEFLGRFVLLKLGVGQDLHQCHAPGQLPPKIVALVTLHFQRRLQFGCQPFPLIPFPDKALYQPRSFRNPPSVIHGATDYPSLNHHAQTASVKGTERDGTEPDPDAECRRLQRIIKKWERQLSTVQFNPLVEQWSFFLTSSDQRLKQKYGRISLC